MPLDEVARRYADNIYRRVAQTIPQKQNEELTRIANLHAANGSVLSAAHISAQARVYLESIRIMAEARAEGLLKAYTHSGTPFNEVACNEVKSEVTDFCSNQQHSVIGEIGRKVTQLFGPQVPPNLHHALSSQIVGGVSSIISSLACALEIKRDEIILDQMKVIGAYAAGFGKDKDVFISHASEDKNFVRPLADALQKSGLSVWYDEFALTVGDGLRKKIDEGLAHSRYGIVVLSHSFFAKEWSQFELDGLISKEVGEIGIKVILPVWHQISFDEVKRYSPMLSGRFAAKSSDGLEVVVQKLRSAMALKPEGPPNA